MIFENLLSSSAEFEEIYDAAKSSKFPISISGISDSARVHIAYSLCRKLNKKLLFVTYSESNAKRLAEDCGFFFNNNTMVYPERELLFYDIAAAANDIRKTRLSVVDSVFSGKDVNIVTTIQALLSPTLDAKKYKENIIFLENGADYDLETLSVKMTEFGYTRVDMVE